MVQQEWSNWKLPKKNQQSNRYLNGEKNTSSKDSNANGLTCLLLLQNRPIFSRRHLSLAGPSGKDPNPLSSWINWSWISWVSSRFLRDLWVYTVDVRLWPFVPCRELHDFSLELQLIIGQAYPRGPRAINPQSLMVKSPGIVWRWNPKIKTN